LLLLIGLERGSGSPKPPGCKLLQRFSYDGYGRRSKGAERRWHVWLKCTIVVELYPEGEGARIWAGPST